jgi:hypothetical protein
MENNKTCFVISCITGCTCCAYDNHYRGFYQTREDAQLRIDYFLHGKYWPVSSQYASRGKYQIEEYEYETIGKNISEKMICYDRIIVLDHVYPLNWVIPNKDGSLIDEESDRIDFV